MRLTFISIEVDERPGLTSKNPHASENDPNYLFFCSCPQLHRRIKKLSFLDQTHHASFPFLTRRISDLPFPTRRIMLSFLFGPDASVIFLFGPDASRNLPFLTRRIKGPAFLGHVPLTSRLWVTSICTHSKNGNVQYVTWPILCRQLFHVQGFDKVSNSMVAIWRLRPDPIWSVLIRTIHLNS